MIKILKYTEYLYLAVFLVCVYEVITKWNMGIENLYLYIFFGVVSIGMFFFRRKYRRRFEQRKRDNQQ